MSWGDSTRLYDLKSSSKSIGVTLLGVALKDGKVQLHDPAKKYHPDFGVPPATNAQTGWLDKITLGKGPKVTRHKSSGAPSGPVRIEKLVAAGKTG